MILRAYYGLRADIRTYLNLHREAKSQYWNDKNDLSENIGELFIVNVTTAVRFKLDNSFGGLKIGTDGGKQFIPGFMNPIPDWMPESSNPHCLNLCVIVK